MLHENLKRLQSRIEQACERSHRPLSEIKLILVTKSVSMEVIRQAYDLGYRDFGENRAQEFEEKRMALPRDVRWHFIGHLQTNKAKNCTEGVHMIHSLDRFDLARALHREAEKRGVTLKCLVQVNTSGEMTKSGLKPADVKPFVDALRQCPRIVVNGLMTIGPHVDNHLEIRRAFRELHAMREDLNKSHPDFSWNELSMGMSGDFEMAIDEGATMLRIGTAAFGPRENK